jgi:hypothetical protein
MHFIHALAAFMLLGLGGLSTLACAQTAAANERGDLLYNTYCLSCHTMQVHWRNDKKAYDWDSLTYQVRRWQGNTGLDWSESDIMDVARYLNVTIYRYPQLNDHALLVLPKASPSAPSHH